MADKYIKFSRVGSLAIIQLTREKGFNAINTDMLNEMIRVLSEYPDDWILTRGTKKVFSSGSDLIDIFRNPKKIFDRLHDQYKHCDKLSKHGKNISIWEGLVMGLGFGISGFNEYRVATDTTQFAMPECAIGLVTDNGSNYLFSRMEKGMGRFLALTGTRINGADCYELGLATHYVPLEKIEDMVTDMSQTQDIKGVLDTYHTTPSHSSLAAQESRITACFDNVTSVSQIFDRCKATEWGRETLKLLDQQCPFSILCNFEIINQASSMDLREVIQMEYKTLSHMAIIDNANCLAFMQHRMISKQKSRPPWNPLTFNEVTEEQVREAIKAKEIPSIKFD